MSTTQPVALQDELHAHHPSHGVQLYGADEGVLAINVAKFLAEGLERSEGVLAIASPEHIASFKNQLRLLGVDVNSAIEQRQLLFLDAQTTLDQLMVDGWSDTSLIEKKISATLDLLRGTSEWRRGYGEMVGLLWQSGDTQAALQLESLWNGFMQTGRLQLLCAYPVDVFDSAIHSPDIEQLLRVHTHIVPTGEDRDLERAVKRAIDDYTPPGSPKRELPTTLLAEWLAVPKAENTILALKNYAPDHAQDILTRARQYYGTEKRFRALIENSSDAILLTSPQGEILYASPSTLRVLGSTPGAVMGGNYLDLIHPDYHEAVRQTLASTSAKPRHALQFEARVREDSGEWRWVEATVADLSADPAVGGIVWNYRDVSERKASEHALRESRSRLTARERYLQATLDSMPECVKVLGRDGEVLEMNAAGLRILEADSMDQVIGKCVYPVIDEADRDAFRALNESVFQGGAGGSLEFTVNGFKGARRTLETNVVPLRDEADRVVGALSSTRDVTERKAAEMALRHAKDGLEQFAYAAAHDLQEPIRNVALYTELLATTYSDKLDARAGEIMKVTVEGAHRLEALVRDLLAYTRSLDLPHGEAALRTDANEVAADVLADLRSAIEAASAEVIVADLPQLPVYRAHLVQLLQNLIGNALKYHSDRPLRIEVSTVERLDEFEIAVQDNGIGIHPDYREQIFGVFKRLHDRTVPGNGIGLAICHRIIAHYEGRIWVEARQEHGATFVFTLPRRRT